MEYPVVPSGETYHCKREWEEEESGGNVVSGPPLRCRPVCVGTGEDRGWVGIGRIRVLTLGTGRDPTLG